MNKLIASATAVILRQGEQSEKSFKVLLLKRNSKLSTHGGGWVFPGGKVDDSDYGEFASSALNGFFELSKNEQPQVAKTAALRESFEEAGLTLDPNKLQLCSTWLTPEEMPKRFDTWFFITQDEQGEVEVDGSEISEHRWFTPEEAIACQQAGEISLPPPTFITLKCLMQHNRVDSALEAMSTSPIFYKPKLIAMESGFCSLYEEDAGYIDKNIDSRGARHRLTMVNGQYDYVCEY